MRLLFLLCLISIASIATGANVTIKCDNMPVEAFIAELARQSGEKIALAAPTDKRITAKLVGVSIEQALEAVSGLCDGVFTNGEAGYRVYPKPTPEHVLGLIRQAHSGIRDIEVCCKTQVNFETGFEETRQETATWKSPGLYRIEGTIFGGEKVANTLTVCDGETRWYSQSDWPAVRKLGVPENAPPLPLSGPVDLGAIAFLPNPDPARQPGLECTSVEKDSGRALFILEFRDEQPGWSRTSRVTGSLRQSLEGLEIAYLFQRPQLELPPDSPVTRIGVDADTGLAVLKETADWQGASRLEAPDIREVAPGIYFPFRMVHKRVRSDGESEVDMETVAIQVRVNFGPDEDLFTFKPAPDVFISEWELDRGTCAEQLKERPDDADLHYRYAELMGPYAERDAPTALEEYKRAAELRPAARPKLLPSLLDAATHAKSVEDAVEFITELRKAHPGDREMALAIAQAYADLGMVREALDEYGRLAATYENRAEAPLLEVAGLCEKQGDRSRAEQLCLELMRIGDDRQSALAAGRLAGMYTEEKRLESLRSPLEAALERHPDSPELLAEYGLMLLEVGEPDRAMDVFRRADLKDCGCTPRPAQLRASEGDRAAVPRSPRGAAEVCCYKRACPDLRARKAAGERRSHRLQEAHQGDECPIGKGNRRSVQAAVRPHGGERRRPCRGEKRVESGSV